MKWLIAAVALMGLIFPLSYLTEAGAIVDVVSVLIGCLVPISIGVAVLRYRLYDIDRIVSRSLSWTIATGGLLIAFIGLVIGLQSLLEGLTQGGTLAVAMSTLVTAALFQPVRRRVQHVVDRRFDRAGYDADRTAIAFAHRLRERGRPRYPGDRAAVHRRPCRPAVGDGDLAGQRDRAVGQGPRFTRAVR